MRGINLFIRNIKYNNFSIIFAFFIIMAYCSESKTPDTGSAGSENIKLMGKLQVGDSSNPPDEWKMVSGTLNTTKARSTDDADDLSIYELYCVTFEEPPQAGSGTADITGNFSLTLEDIENVAFGCFVRQDNLTVATMVFEDINEQGLDGENIRQGSISLMGNSDLGIIILDLDRGIALVNMDNINSVTDDAGSWDFTGTITMTRVEPVPEGYDEVPDCTPGGISGPCSGMSVYLHRLVGRSFTPDAACEAAIVNGEVPDSCNGTTSEQNDFYGIMVWDSKLAMETCGNRVGFEDIDARASGGVAIDLAASGDIEFGELIWTLTTPEYSFMEEPQNDPSWSYSYGWAIAEATSLSEIVDCIEEGGDWICFPPVPEPADILLGQNQPCKDILQSNFGADYTDKLMLECFARFYDRFYLRRDENHCMRDMNFDWEATMPNDFVTGMGGSVISGTQFVIEPWIYTGPGSGTFSQNGEYIKGIDYQDEGMNYWVGCRTAESLTMSVTKISSSKAIGDMQIINSMVDDDPRCVANKDQLEHSTRMMMNMNY
jgi:hypothetical protein